jgi:hypothetical protein
VFSIDQKIVRREEASTRAPNIKVRLLLHLIPLRWQRRRECFHPER